MQINIAPSHSVMLGLAFESSRKSRQSRNSTGLSSSSSLLRALTGHRASLVAKWVKNPPAMQETLVQFLSWEDALEKG